MRSNKRHSTHPHCNLLALIGSLPLLTSLACSDGTTPDPDTRTETGTDAGTVVGEFRLQDEYEPPAGMPGSTAIANDDPRIVAWASDFTDLTLGDEVDEGYDDPTQALGPAEGETDPVVSLGNGGVISLLFNAPIRNQPGPDFAVFENAFDNYFLELAFVEVSSNGRDFQRFDSAYLGDDPIGQYDTHDTELIGGLAGKYRVGFGTPFDLELLSHKDLVESGDVDLDAITHVKIVDIIGDGSQEDSFGHPIYDPTPTVGTAGFDLDGVGVIHMAD